MIEQIDDAIRLLQTAKTSTPEQVPAIVTQAVELLLKAIKDNQGVDLEKGGGG